MTFLFAAGMCLGIRISVVSCAGKRKRRNQQEIILFFLRDLFGNRRKMQSQDKRFYLGIFWSASNTYAYPAKITWKYV